MPYIVLMFLIFKRTPYIWVMQNKKLLKFFTSPSSGGLSVYYKGGRSADGNAIAQPGGSRFFDCPHAGAHTTGKASPKAEEKPCNACHKGVFEHECRQMAIIVLAIRQLVFQLYGIVKLALSYAHILVAHASISRTTAQLVRKYAFLIALSANMWTNYTSLFHSLSSNYSI